MARSAVFVLALLALGAVAHAAEERTRLRDITPDSVRETLGDFFKFAQEEGQKAVEEFSGKHPKLAALGAKRNLLTVGQSLQEFMSGILGSKWQDFLPASWASESFDWGKLGEFDYSSNLGDFVDAHDVKNLTNIGSVKDLHETYTAVEENFCTPEEFSLSAKVPASCTGPTVTIALVPKVCILEAATKQVVCDPAKLVLTKAPGSCTHKYRSASTWTGKSCKISGGAGFTDSYTVGGGEKLVPLAQFDIAYTAK